MKTSTSDLRALLHGSTHAAFSDLITVTLADATVARWTTDTYDLTYGGNTYLAGGSGTAPIITRGKIREAVGLEVSTMDLTLGCGTAGTASIGGTDIRQLAVSGGLDDARVSVSRAYMATPGGSVVGVVDRFNGLITDCEADSNEIRARVQSDLYRLEEQLPRHLIREKCSWALGDSGCGVNLASFTVTDTCEAGCTTTLVKLSRATALPWSGFGGTITFTSGALTGLRRTVTSWSATLVTVYEYELAVAQLPSAPANGDGITIVAGCDKTIATCLDVFSGGVASNPPFTRRRGFDFVPPPDSVTR